MEPAECFAARLVSFQARHQVEPVLTVRGGGSRRPISPIATDAATAFARRTGTTVRPKTPAHLLRVV